MKKSFLMYDNYGAMFQMLPDEMAGKLIKAIFAYRENGTLTVEDPALKAVMAMVVDRMQEDEESYAETCERRRKAVENRWAKRKEVNTEVFDSIQEDTSVYKSMQENTNDTDSDSDSDIYKKEKKESKKKEKQKAFIPPTLDEVKAYVKEKGYTFSPDAFVGYYGSNGWMVGRTKMKDWKSACVTWQSKEAKKPVVKKPNWNIESRDYDFDDLERRLMG